MTFEYGIRKLKDKSNTEELSELPFQLQISYTTPDGAKALRVYTKIQKFTGNRDEAEKNLAQDLIYSNAMQKMSYQVLTNNVNVAKYRQKQMRNLELKNRWTTPAAYQSNISMVKKMKKSTRAEDLSDTTAEEMYSGKKMNRSKFGKK